MKKIIILLFINILIITGIYFYYESKTDEVFLSGKVIGLDIKNINEETSNINKEVIPTSSKSVGTITFTKKDSNEFVGLGHSIDSNAENLKLDGECYEIEFDYIKRAKQSKAGKIIAEINEEKKLGSLNKSNKYGIYGKFDKLDDLEQIIKTENRFNIKKGLAYILINVDGQGIQKYEVNVDEINYFSTIQNIRITVKSEELIKLSGGIVQGMSGAPLIQNGKLIGAINCVNVNNSLDAYAIFIDKLL